MSKSEPARGGRKAADDPFSNAQRERALNRAVAVYHAARASAWKAYCAMRRADGIGLDHQPERWPPIVRVFEEVRRLVVAPILAIDDKAAEFRLRQARLTDDPQQIPNPYDESREAVLTDCLMHLDGEIGAVLVGEVQGEYAQRRGSFDLSLKEAARDKRNAEAAENAAIETKRADAKGVAEPKADGPKRPTGTINERMLGYIQANPEANGWTSKQWAEHLKCAKSSVVETATWKQLNMLRLNAKAERMRDRHRRPKASDQRRD